MLRICKLCSWAATQRWSLMESKAFWYLPEIFLLGWRGSPVFLFFPPPSVWRFFSRPFKLAVCEQRCSWWMKLRGLIKGLLPTGTHTRAELSRAGSGPASSMFLTRVAMATRDELMWRNQPTEQRACCGCGRCSWPCWRRRALTPPYYPRVAARLPAVAVKAWPSNSIWARRLRWATTASAPRLARESVLAPGIVSTMDTGIKAEKGWLPRAGSLNKQHQTQSLVVDPGCPGCTAVFSQFYLHTYNYSQPSYSIICFLGFSVNNFFSPSYCEKLLYLNTQCSIFSHFLQLQYIDLWILQLVTADLPYEAYTCCKHLCVYPVPPLWLLIAEPCEI